METELYLLHLVLQGFWWVQEMSWPVPGSCGLFHAQRPTSTFEWSCEWCRKMVNMKEKCWLSHNFDVCKTLLPDFL